MDWNYWADVGAWAKSMTLSSMIVMTVAALVHFIAKWRRQRAYLQQLADEEKNVFDPIIRLNNGWVEVEHRSVVPDNKPVHLSTVAGVPLPQTVSMMLDELTPKTILEIIVLLRHVAPDAENADDMRRGLTIGSALFNYSIPESFVLLDRRTQLLADVFRYHEAIQQTSDVWLETHADVVAKNRRLIAEFEMNCRDLTKQKAIDFYFTHYGFIASWVMAVSHWDYYPHAGAFVEGLLRRLRLDFNDEAISHQMFVAITVIVRLLGIQVPHNWVCDSPYVDAVLQAAKLVEPTRPGLRLVTNNE